MAEFFLIGGAVFFFIVARGNNRFRVLFFLQIFRNISDEWIDLAKIEGLNHYQTFLLLLPLIKPGLISFFLLHFVLCFHEHLLPLLMLDDENLTLPLALAKLKKDSSHRIPESVGMAASLLSIVPIFVMFVFAFKNLRTALREVMHS